MKRRRGHSLVEMLVVMSAASTVLSLSAALIHRTMHLASRTQAFHAEEATAWRLSSQLRDAADATAIDLALADARLTLTLHPAVGLPIRYRFVGPRVERTQPLEQGREAREEFKLPSVASWTAESVEQSTAVRIEATPSTAPTQSPAPIPLRLVVHAAAEGSP